MLLLDSWQRLVPLQPGVERIVRSVTPIARRFVFDAEACTHVGHLLLNASDLVCEQIVFAKPPYDHTYIELQDLRGMFNAWRPGNVNSPETSDDKIGLLYTMNRLYVFCSSYNSPMQTLGMFATTMGHGQTTPLNEIFGDEPISWANERVWQTDTTNADGVIPDIRKQPRPWQDYVKLSYLLGGMRQQNGSILLPRTDYEYFLGNYDLSCVLADPRDRKARSKTMFNAAFQGGGDLLIGAACLLLIHGKRRGVSIQTIPHKRGIWKGKAVVYRTHGVVSIKLGVHDTMRQIVFGTRDSPRLHDVMGTWVHYHRDRHCEHDWRRLPDQEHERYQCSKCPTLRTWRTPHVRGDASKGVKTKTYSVED